MTPEAKAYLARAKLAALLYLDQAQPPDLRLALAGFVTRLTQYPGDEFFGLTPEVLVAGVETATQADTTAFRQWLMELGKVPPEPLPELTTHRVAAMKCPWCDHPVDAATNTEFGYAKRPDPGDFSVCIKCYSPMRFGADVVTLERCTDREMRDGIGEAAYKKIDMVRRGMKAAQRNG